MVEPKKEETPAPQPETNPITPPINPAPTQPVQPVQPVQPTPSTLPNNEILQGQQNSEAIINEIMLMGFERPQIEQALRAAFFNKERAIDYLLNGIPQNLLNDMASNYFTIINLNKR